MKDNFSANSEKYQRYRPAYPDKVYKLIFQYIKQFDLAWDCGTGNGQVAGELAKTFCKVEATDISENQLKNAVQRENINYSLMPAEKTSFHSNVFDLIISAQAIHWFNFSRFYAEVNRCLKPDGLIVILGYGLFRSTPEVNNVINRLYKNILGIYWDAERKYLDENYKTIPFPFEEIDTPDLVQEYIWKADHLLGYLRTWSAVKHYQDKHQKDPVTLVESELRKAFGTRNKVVFPILFRMGNKWKADQ